MEKLYVNEIGPDGEVSTVGLFYSQPKPKDRRHAARRSGASGYRYEIVEAVRHVLSENESRGRRPAIRRSDHALYQNDSALRGHG